MGKVMEITRRKFFFFGLAAGVGLFLPDIKIELTKEEFSYYGVPYHENNASAGIWQGIYRGDVYEEISNLVRLLEQNKRTNA